MKATLRFHKTQIANYVSIDCNGKQISKILSPDNKKAKKEFERLIELFEKRNIEIEVLNYAFKIESKKEQKRILKKKMVDRIFALKSQGWSFQKIADKLNTKRNIIFYHYKKQLKQAA